MTMYLRQSWHDPRLSIPSTSGLRKIPAYFLDDIWVPDTVIRNEISASMHDVTVDNKLLFIRGRDVWNVWYVMK